MNKDISIGDILQENFIRSSTDYISSIQKLPESSSIDEQTSYRNKITTDLLHSVFMANEPESFYQESSVYHFSHFDQDVPTVKPLLYFLEKINSMKITQESVSSIREAVEDLKSHILESVMGGSEASISGDEYVERLYRYFRENDESINQESVAENTNSVLNSMKKYVSEYNSCINTFRSFSNKMKDESMKSLVESVESLTNRYLKYANIAYAVKADAVRQYVLDTYNAHTESSKELYMPVKESVFDDFDIVGDDIIEENRIEYNTAYQSIAESQMINALLEDLSEEFNSYVEAINATGVSQPQAAQPDAAKNATSDNTKNSITDKVINFFKKIWDWIKSIFKTTTENFQKNLLQIVGDNLPWLENKKEIEQIKANAAKSDQTVNLPNYETGIRRINTALAANFKTTEQAAQRMLDAQTTEGVRVNLTDALADTLRSEIIDTYKPDNTNNTNKESFTKVCKDYFVGADDTKDVAYRNLPIDNIVSSISNKENIKAIVTMCVNSSRNAEKEIGSITKEATDLYKKQYGKDPNVRISNTATTAKPAQSGTGSGETGTNSQPAASKFIGDLSLENTDIFKILDKYSSVRTVNEAEEGNTDSKDSNNATTTSRNSSTDKTKSDTSSTKTGPEKDKPVNTYSIDPQKAKELQNRMDYWRTVGKVRNEIATSTMNAYREFVVRYIGILNGLRNNANNQNNNGNNTQAQQQQ